MADNFVPLPPAFHGKGSENLRDYIACFKIYTQLKEIDELNDVRLHFGHFLRDRAFKWYQDNLATQVNNVDAYYELFITAFLREEPDSSKMCRLRERKYKVDDTPQTYADDILTLCQKFNLNEAAQIQYLIGGIPDQMQSFISALNPLTFSAAFNAIYSMRKNLEENVKSEPIQPTSNPKLALLATQIYVLTSELQQMKLKRPDFECYIHPTT